MISGLPFFQSPGNFTGLLYSGQYADACIRLSANVILENQESVDMLVHKVILAGQTSFFADLFASEPCELKPLPLLSKFSSHNEKTTQFSIGVWMLQIDSIENFKTVIEWMYTSKLALCDPCTKSNCLCTTSNGISSAEMRLCLLQKAWGVLRLSCKFGLPKLIEIVEMDVLLSFVKTPYDFEEYHWFRIVIDAMNSGASTSCIKMIVSLAIDCDFPNKLSISPTKVDNKEKFEQKLAMFNKKITEFQIKNSNITKEKQELLFNVLWSEFNFAIGYSAFAQPMRLPQKQFEKQHESLQSWSNLGSGFNIPLSNTEAASETFSLNRESSIKLNKESNLKSIISPEISRDLSLLENSPLTRKLPTQFDQTKLDASLTTTEKDTAEFKSLSVVSVQENSRKHLMSTLIQLDMVREKLENYAEQNNKDLKFSVAETLESLSQSEEHPIEQSVSKLLKSKHEVCKDLQQNKIDPHFSNFEVVETEVKNKTFRLNDQNKLKLKNVSFEFHLYLQYNSDIIVKKEDKNENVDKDKAYRPKKLKVKTDLHTTFEIDEKIRNPNLKVEPQTIGEKNKTIRMKKGIKDLKSATLNSSCSSPMTDKSNFLFFLDSDIISIDEKDKNKTIKASACRKSQHIEPISKNHIIESNSIIKSKVKVDENETTPEILDSKSIFVRSDKMTYSSLDKSDIFVVSEMFNTSEAESYDDNERNSGVSLPKFLIHDKIPDALNTTEKLIYPDFGETENVSNFTTTSKLHINKKGLLEDEDNHDSLFSKTQCSSDKNVNSSVQKDKNQTLPSIDRSFDLTIKIAHIPECYASKQVRKQISDPYMHFSSRSSSTLPANFEPLERKLGRRENYAALNVAASQQMDLLKAKIPKKTNVINSVELDDESALPWLDLTSNKLGKNKRRPQLPSKPLQKTEQIPVNSKSDSLKIPSVPFKIEKLGISDIRYQTLPLRSSFSEGDLSTGHSIRCKKEENIKKNLLESKAPEISKSHNEIIIPEISSVSTKIKDATYDQLKKLHPLRHSFSADNIQPSTDYSSSQIEDFPNGTFNSVSQMQVGTSQSLRSGIKPGGPRQPFRSSANSQAAKSNRNEDLSSLPPETTLMRTFWKFMRGESHESGSLNKRKVWDVTATLVKRKSSKFSLKNSQPHVDTIKTDSLTFEETCENEY
ncbi:hypothetical protein HK096_002556 [Nowakowskiella sp. JEL0078]|nr:hypothetical protein HK096_002556 [Nowakowskiella sp. JEL0078]